MCVIIVVNQTHIRVVNEIYTTLIQKNKKPSPLSKVFLKNKECLEKFELDHKLGFNIGLLQRIM